MSDPIVCTKHYLVRAKERLGINEHDAIKLSIDISQKEDARELYTGETREYISYVVCRTIDVEKIIIHEDNLFVVKKGNALVTVLKIPQKAIPDKSKSIIKKENEYLFEQLKEIKKTGYTKKKAKEIAINVLHRIAGNAMGNCPSKKRCIEYAIQRYGQDW